MCGPTLRFLGLSPRTCSKRVQFDLHLETKTMTEMIRRLTALCLLVAFVGCGADSDGDFSSPEDQEKMKRRETGKTRAAPGSQLGSPAESDGGQ